MNGPSWGRTSDQSGRVDNQCVSNYPSPNRACIFQCTRLSSNYFRKGKAFELSSFDFVTCVPSPCTGHYPDHLSTMDTPSPCVCRRLGDPQVPLKLWSECRFLVRCFTRSWRISQGKRSTALITTAIDPVVHRPAKYSVRL
jgi:hypothetical protein